MLAHLLFGLKMYILKYLYNKFEVEKYIIIKIKKTFNKMQHKRNKL